MPTALNESADPFAAGAAAANALLSGEAPIAAQEGVVVAPYETDIAALTGVNQKLLRQSTTCKEYQNGLCNRGASCKFSHGLAMVGVLGVPNAGGMAGGAAFGGPAALCFDFKMGRCERATGCKFSHGETPVPGMPSTPMPAANVALCLDFQKGMCERGLACQFSHAAPAGLGPTGLPVSIGAGMNFKPTWGGEVIP